MGASSLNTLQTYVTLVLSSNAARKMLYILLYIKWRRKCQLPRRGAYAPWSIVSPLEAGNLTYKI